MTKRIAALFTVISVILSFLPTVYAGLDTTGVSNFVIITSNTDAGGKIDKSTKKSGAAALRLYNNTPESDNGEIRYIMMYQNITVEKGAEYVYGMSIKADNANKVYTVVGNYYQADSLLPFGNRFDWTDVRFTYKHNKNDTVMPFYVKIDALTKAFWIDDMYFYKVDEYGNKVGDNLIKNGGFETISNTAKIISVPGEDGNTVMINEAPQDIKIDADFSEWTDAKKYHFDVKGQSYQVGVPMDLDADIMYMYDKDYLYFAIDTADNMHFGENRSDYWNCDGVQFVVSSADESYGKEMGLVYDEANDNSIVFDCPGALFKGKRENGHTFYEAAIPWSVRGWTQPPAQLKFGAILNENDGAGRISSVELAPGISSDKTNAAFPVLIPFNRSSGFVTILSSSDVIHAGENVTYNLCIASGYDTTKQIKVSIPEFSYAKTFSVGGGKTASDEITAKIMQSGEKTIKVISELDGKKTESDVDFTILPNKEITEKYIGDVKKYRKELEELIYECNKKGIPIDYELANYNILETYEKFMENDNEYEEYAYAAHTYEKLTEIYQNTKDNLNAYLKGEKKAFSVPKSIGFDYEIKDGSFWTDMVLEDGTVEKRPVFYNGYLSSNENTTSYKDMSKLGLARCVLGLEMDSGYGIVPDSKIPFFSTTNDDLCEITDKEKNSGNYALRVSVPEGEKTVSLTQSDIGLGDLTDYTLKFTAKAKNLKSASVSLNSEVTVSMKDTFDWQEFSIDFSTGTMEISRPLKISVGNCDEFYIDDITIIPREGGYDRMNNGGFEAGEGLKSEKGYIFNESYAERLMYQVKEAEKNNLFVYFNFPWYMGNNWKVFKESCPEMLTGQRGHFNHEEFLEFCKFFVRNMMPRFIDCKNMHSLCIFNEPSLNSKGGKEYYKPFYNEYLRDLYNDDINALNECYQTDYASFEDIPLPSGTDSSNYFYDWMQFNNDTLADYFKTMTEEFRKACPDIPLQVKIMEYVFKVDTRLDYGNDYEKWTDMFDINGCDSYGYASLPSYPIVSRLEWYDFMTSLKNVPVMDTERHIMPDGTKIDTTFESTVHSDADIWQGAIHKMGGTSLWLIDRSVDIFRMAKIFETTNISLTPERYAAYTKTAYDINRLGKEIQAIKDKVPEMAVLYTQIGVQKNTMYTGNLHQAYVSGLYSGQKVFIMNESRAEDILTNGVKTLVIPDVTNLKANTVSVIKKFIEGGGKVVIIGEDSLKYDEYDRPQDKETLDYITANSKVYPFEKDKDEKEFIDEVVTSEVQDLCTVKLRDKNTGEDIKNTEFWYADYNGKTVVNVCSYDWSGDKTFEVYKNGVKINEISDIRNGEDYTESVTIKPFSPVLLEFQD